MGEPIIIDDAGGMELPDRPQPDPPSIRIWQRKKAYDLEGLGTDKLRATVKTTVSDVVVFTGSPDHPEILLQCKGKDFIAMRLETGPKDYMHAAYDGSDTLVLTCSDRMELDGKSDPYSYYLENQGQIGTVTVWMERDIRVNFQGRVKVKYSTT